MVMDVARVVPDDEQGEGDEFPDTVEVGPESGEED
jgi:hypothetical protein